MANVKIAIKDESSARQWRDKVLLVNDEYHDAMREAAETLQGAKDFADGTMVDEFYNLGTGLLNASEKVFNTLNEISSVVNNVLGKAASMIGNVVSAIGGVKNILG